jgi:lipid A ethanolaminephosphotransferase
VLKDLQLFRQPLGTVSLILLTSLWLAGVGNIAIWRALWLMPEITGWHGMAFLLAFFALIAALHAAFLSLFAWRPTFKPVLIFCLIAAALGANFMLTYGVVIDRTMMVNVLQTDVRESKELLNLQLIVILGLMAMLPAAWVWRLELKSGTFLSQLKRNVLTLLGAMVVAVVVVMLTYQSMASVMRNHKQIRFMINPLNSIYALGEIALEPFARPKKAMVSIGQDAKLGATWQNRTKPPLLVLVVGETARAANFSLNGYARETNPELAKENITSFLDVHSCGTSTAASVPCMFSHLGREAYGKRDADYENLLDVLKHAGLSVLWRDNNAGCKGTCTNIESEDLSHGHDPEFCASQECFDEVMLHQLNERLTKLTQGDSHKGIVLVLHQKGSHGPAYYIRSPKAFKKFMPECETNALQSCTREQVINAYDNTILYTDHFLAQTIEWLKTRADHYDTAMLYVSDHGESLGENNTYLHGLPYMIAPDVQKHVPMVVWMSPQMEQRSGISTTCLQGQRNAALSHDNLFHSVLGLLDVKTDIYRADRDLFKPCEAKP